MAIKKTILEDCSQNKLIDRRAAKDKPQENTGK
jgi:hypothetical protein